LTADENNLIIKDIRIDNRFMIHIIHDLNVHFSFFLSSRKRNMMRKFALRDPFTNYACMKYLLNSSKCNAAVYVSQKIDFSA